MKNLFRKAPPHRITDEELTTAEEAFYSKQNDQVVAVCDEDCNELGRITFKPKLYKTIDFVRNEMIISRNAQFYYSLWRNQIAQQPKNHFVKLDKGKWVERSLIKVFIEL